MQTNFAGVKITSSWSCPPVLAPAFLSKIMTTKKEYPPTPELDKMKAVHPQSQKVGEFIEWLQAKGVQLGRPHQHGPNCAGWDDDKGRYKPGLLANYCPLESGQFESFNFTIETLLAEFFEIDLNKAEEEKLAILAHVRGEQ